MRTVTEIYGALPGVQGDCGIGTEPPNVNFLSAVVAFSGATLIGFYA